MAKAYYMSSADELIYIDIVASLYGRSNLIDIVNRSSDDIFIPLTVGGGVRNLDDIQALLSAGADKVAINTAAVKNPNLVSEAAERFGSQCIVGSVEAKRMPDGSWESFTNNGRERTGLDAIAWAGRLQELGVGEILLTSIDQEGTRKGYDLELTKRASAELSCPLIACGGAGSTEDLVRCVCKGDVDALALSSLLHYEKSTVEKLKAGLADEGIDVRKIND
jgi:cyclase